MAKIKFGVDYVMPQLSQVASLVSPKNTMPIFGCILCNVRGEDLIVTASDGETWLQMHCSLLESDCDLDFCVDAKDFLSALKNLQGGGVTLNIDNDTHTIVGDYGKGTFKLPYLNASEYPLARGIDDKHEYTINSKVIYDALSLAEFATANDELRPQMNGIHIDFDNGKMTSAATDGRKLVRYINTNVDIEGEETIGLTIPKKPAHSLVALLAKMDNDIAIEFNSSNACFKCDYFSLVTRLADGRYPNYNGVIPQPTGNVAIVDKSEIISAVKRVMTFGNASNELLAIHVLFGQIEISAEDFEYSKSARETINCEYGGGEIKIGFCATFFLQSLSNIQSDKVSIEFIDKSRPCVFRPIDESLDYVSILMPMVL